MKKIVFTILTFLSFAAVFAQEDTVIHTPSLSKKQFDLSDRPGDHFVIQLTSDHWTGMPDSISSHQNGFSRGLNIYVMTDKPFRGDSRFSVGLGIGVGSSNMIFKKMNVDVKSTSSKIPFTASDSSNHFKKYKLSMSYLEAPVEIRYASNPGNSGKSWKIAIGVKVGTLINLHTKGKDLQDKNNKTILSYTAKENSKRYFTGTRLMGTARVGYGIFSLFGSYQINNVLKDGFGPDMKLYQVGIMISGL
ncbi:MAG: outer membrane beta-barrel protein [Ginsengibacter sp.]